MRQNLCLLCFVVFLSFTASVQAQQRWSETQAREWYVRQPWLVGNNFLPSNAANELEMWQADTFDSREIDKEFGWAEASRHEHHARFSARSFMARCRGF